MFLRRFTALFMVLALFIPGGASRADDSVFTVDGIKVDVTADSAVAAREKAFVQASEDAFRTLAERLMTEGDIEKFETPSPEAISLMVNDFEITDEHLSRVQYVGTYTFRFKSDAVRQWMNGRGARSSDVRSKPLLVLPFYQRGSETVLWGDKNPWMAAWSRSTAARDLVPTMVPMGDLQDTADMGDGAALTYTPEALQSMVERYDSGEAVIMMASPVWSGTPVPDQVPDELTVKFYRADSAGPEYVQSLKFEKQDGESEILLFDRAVKESRKLVQSNWKNKMAVTNQEQNRLDVRVRFSSMKEWIDTQKALRQVQGVGDVKVVSLKSGQARVHLAFQGSEERLRLALAQADMTLTMPQVSFEGGNSPLVYDLFLNRYAPSGTY